MADPDRVLVFDIGGTQLRAAVYDGSSNADRAGAAALSEVRAVASPSYLTRPESTWDELRRELVSAMSKARAELDPTGRIARAAVAFPGPVDAERRVLAAPPIWGTLGHYPYAFEDDLHAAWPGVEVRILNDVSAAGYRYLRDARDEFCVVTVSSGIGNKVFVGGRPLIGRAASGGEIGHLRVDRSPSAALCDCGGTGHLATVASGRGIAARAREQALRAPLAFRESAIARTMGLEPETISAEAIAQAYGSGDTWAIDEVQRAAGALGAVFASIHLGIGVERFVLIGGLATGLGPRFAATVQAALHRNCWRGAAQGEHVEVVLGESDGRCALIGGGRGVFLGLLG